MNLIQRSFQCGLALGILSLFSIGHAGTANPSIQQNAQNTPPPEVQEFISVMGHVKKHYVKPVDDKTLFTHAMKGMVSNLDPHSAYLDAESLKQLQTATTGQFAGIGIEISPANGVIQVVTPLDDSPAANAGIKAGDFIIRINNTLLDGMDLNEVVKLIRGPVNSELTMTIVRKGQEPFTVTLRRATIKVKNIKSHLYDSHYGYIRIAQFQEDTKKQLVKTLRDLQRQSHESLYGIVLDLRNNPGGLLHSAAEVSDLFLDSEQLENKTIVYAKDRHQRVALASKAHPGDWMKGRPIVVLINAGSASASEIVAGALQDHDRAIVMGTKSFGKGSVQTVFPISEDSALKITTHLYYTPNNHKIQAKGIIPNIIIDDTEVTTSKKSHGLSPIMESQLSKHIKPKGEVSEEGKLHQAKLDSKLAQQDYQLYQAINLLKGLNVARSSH